MFESVTESGISGVKKDIIDDVITKKDQLNEMYSSNMAKIDSSDSVKTELIIKEEQITEINSAEFIDINTITTKEEPVEIFPSESADKETVIHKKQFCEIHFSVPNEVKECIMKEGSTIDLPSEEIKKERFDDLVFSEGISDENNSENKDMTKIKMEDIEIEPEYIDVERDLPSEEIKKQITDDDDVFSEGSSDENNAEDIDITKIKMKDIDIEPNNIDVERNEGSSKWFQCSYCKYKSSLKGNYNRHLKLVHKMQFFSCRRCRYITRDEDCLKKHQVIHGDNAKYECPQCHKVFHSKSVIDNHVLRKHDNLCDIVTSKIHSCNNCSYKTTEQTDLTRHISTAHFNLRPHICTPCKKTFNLKIGLDCHIVSCHQKDLGLMKTVTNKIQNCDYCTFKCIRKREMRTHIKAHKYNV